MGIGLTKRNMFDYDILKENIASLAISWIFTTLFIGRLSQKEIQWHSHITSILLNLKFVLDFLYRA